MDGTSACFLPRLPVQVAREAAGACGAQPGGPHPSPAEPPGAEPLSPALWVVPARSWGWSGERGARLHDNGTSCAVLPPRTHPGQAGWTLAHPCPPLPPPTPPLSLRGERPASGRSLPLGEPRRPGGRGAGPTGPAPGQMFRAAPPAQPPLHAAALPGKQEAWALLGRLPPRWRARSPNGEAGSPAWSWGCSGVPRTPPLTWPPPAALSWPPGLSGAQPRASPRPGRGGEQALLGACQPAQPRGGGRKQDEGERQPSQQPAQAAHHAWRPPLSGRVACPRPPHPPSLRTHTAENRPRHGGASWHPVRLAGRHRARAARQQAPPLTPAPPRRPSRSELAARQPAPRGLSGSEAAAGRQAEGGGQGNPRRREIPRRGRSPDGGGKGSGEGVN